MAAPEPPGAAGTPAPVAPGAAWSVPSSTSLPGVTGAGVPAAPGGSEAATSATGAIGDLPANVVDTLPDVQSAVDPAVDSQPVADLATSAVSP